MIRFHTNYGVIGIELNSEKAPLSAANFLDYVRSGHYDQTLFHRVIAGFMIQGGGFLTGMKQKPCRTPIRNEADNGLQNKAYSVAMARTNDPHSATSQFFINVVDNDFLNYRAATPQGWGYCVVGAVVEGREVVDRIKAVPTGSRGFYSDVPLTDVVIERVEEC